MRIDPTNIRSQREQYAFGRANLVMETIDRLADATQKRADSSGVTGGGQDSIHLEHTYHLDGMHAKSVDLSRDESNSRLQAKRVGVKIAEGSFGETWSVDLGSDGGYRLWETADVSRTEDAKAVKYTSQTYGSPATLHIHQNKATGVLTVTENLWGFVPLDPGR